MCDAALALNCYNRSKVHWVMDSTSDGSSKHNNMKAMHCSVSCLLRMWELKRWSKPGDVSKLILGICYLSLLQWIISLATSLSSFRACDKLPIEPCLFGHYSVGIFMSCHFYNCDRIKGMYSTILQLSMNVTSDMKEFFVVTRNVKINKQWNWSMQQTSRDKGACIVGHGIVGACSH